MIVFWLSPLMASSRPNCRLTTRIERQLPRQPQVEAADRRGLDREAQPRPPIDPLPVGLKSRLDIVVKHVVVNQVVLAVEEPAPGELVLRGVQRNGSAPPTIEQTDVFGIVAEPRVGERVVAGRLDLGDKITAHRNRRPEIRTQVAKIERE